MLARLVFFFLALAAMTPLAAAQHPFGPPPASPSAAPAAAPAAEDPSWTQQIVAAVQAWQQQAYRQIATTLRALKDEGSLGALFALLGLGFVYGVLHAAGPGHGKAVIAAYLAADNSAFRRGIVLSFLSSAAQAATAIFGVGILAMILGFVAREVTSVAYTLERISYLMIAAVGLYLIWRATRDWFGSGGGHRHAHAHGHGHGHGHAHGHHHHDHAHGHDHDHSDHMALPTTRPLLGNLRETIGVIVSIGIRPCQGSVFVLLLSLAFGVFWAGVMAALAIALGTALTVSAIAVFTVAARQSANALLSARPRWLDGTARGIAILAGLFILWIGLALAWAPPPPLMPGAM
jgi:ABC-type nickel/cobalt efflux system permease component RcnA